MPGDKIQFVERWCTATFVRFEYYTRKKSRVDKRKPLFRIDLCDVETVKRADILDKKIPTGEGTYYFEIILKSELGFDPFEIHEDIFASPNSNLNGSMATSQFSGGKSSHTQHT
jgi:hypothetical protein